MNSIERMGRILGLTQEMKQAFEAKDYAKMVNIAAQVRHHLSILVEVGSELSSLQPEPVRAKQPKRRKKTTKDGRSGHRPGSVAAYVKDHLMGMQPGDVKLIPLTGTLNNDKLQASVTALCSYDWGNGSYTTRRFKNGDGEEAGIELMRTK